MRGSPLGSLALVLLALLIAWNPLQRLVGGGDRGELAGGLTADAKGEVMEREVVPTRLRLSFSSVPEWFELSTATASIIEVEEAEGLDLEREVELTVLPEGIELFVDGSWPEGTQRAAARIELAPEGMEERSVTAWSEEEELSEVVEFFWPASR